MDTGLWREVAPTHTQVAGIAVRDKAIADLALLLHRTGRSRLATYVGQAWDRCRPELPLNDRDCTEIVGALQPAPPAELQPLYEALRDHIRANTPTSAPALENGPSEVPLSSCPQSAGKQGASMAGDVRVVQVAGTSHVQREGLDGSHFVSLKQAAAWSAGKALASELRVEAILYGRDGRVREVHGGSRPPKAK
jgi:hypothetical protein